MVGLEARAIHGGKGDPWFEHLRALCGGEDALREAIEGVLPPETMGGLLDGGVVGNSREIEHLAEIRGIGEDCGDTPIVHLEELLEDEDRDELGLGELVRAFGVTV